jgi:DNA polymerase-1
VKIITGDRDLLQLVDDNTQVELPPGQRQRRPQLFDVAAVEQKYNVRVEQFVDMKALIGDKSDNIPGVYGVGEKTAAKLLEEHGTLEGIYENIDQVKGAMKQKLIEGKEDAFLSQKLARIATDVPMEFNLAACVLREFDGEAALAIFQELEFRTLTSRLLSEAEELGEDIGAEPGKAISVRNRKQLDSLVKKLDKADVIAFDVETTGLDKMTARLVGISLSVVEGEAYYIPVGHIEGST